MICWNTQLQCYTIYSLTWSARLDTFEYLNSYCSQSRYQPLLLLWQKRCADTLKEQRERVKAWLHEMEKDRRDIKSQIFGAMRRAHINDW